VCRSLTHGPNPLQILRYVFKSFVRVITWQQLPHFVTVPFSFLDGRGAKGGTDASFALLDQPKGRIRVPALVLNRPTNSQTASGMCLISRKIKSGPSEIVARWACTGVKTQGLIRASPRARGAQEEEGNPCCAFCHDARGRHSETEALRGVNFRALRGHWN
jgi:hypothetical protein